MPSRTVGGTKADDGGEKPQPLYLYRFGSAEFDTRRWELRVDGVAVDVQPIPLQLLELLLESPGELVEKDRIVAVIWHGRAMSDAVIANAASKLRAALGPANDAAIVTVPRQGYRLDGRVERIVVGHSAPRAMVLAEGEPVPGREGFRLVRRLDPSARHDTWLARHRGSGVERVYKFAGELGGLADLKREVTLYRYLLALLGRRQDIVTALDWNFAESPYWIEFEPAGRSLADWAEEEQDGLPRLQALGLAQRVAIIAAVARAVAACHGAEVLHCDLKPANVLIQDLPDGGFRIRLADFGSGELLEPARLEALKITRLGMTVDSSDPTAGTPSYMAPEVQAGEVATDSSDIFALGLMLLQFVVGDLRATVATGWERRVDDPVLRADIAQATDQDPSHRLASAALLADRLSTLDDRRVLQQRQAEADREAAVARDELARARARRPWMIGAMLALATGIVASLLLLDRQRRISDALAAEIEVSEALNQVLREDMIAAANPKAGGQAGITVAEAMSLAALRVDQRFAGRAPQLRGRLHESMQVALSELSRTRDSVDAGRRAVAALAAAGPAEYGRLQLARVRLATDLALQSEVQEAQRVVDQVERDMARSASDEPELRARLLYAKSWISADAWAMKESTDQLLEAESIIATLPAEDAVWRDQIRLSLADNLILTGRAAEAEPLLRGLRDAHRRRYGEDSSQALNAQTTLARAVFEQGRRDEAQALMAESLRGLEARLGAGHREVLTARFVLAGMQLRSGDHPAAVAGYESAHRGVVALSGEGSATAIVMQTSLGVALHRSGQLQQACATLQQALSHARRIQDDSAPMVQEARVALADCLLDAGRAEAAAPLLVGLSADVLAIGWPEPDWPAQLDYQRGRAELAVGDPVSAQRMLERAAAGLNPQGRIAPGHATRLASLAAAKAARAGGGRGLVAR